jgi:hypothetical protein
MIYKFKSKAAGDLIMLGPQGEQMLRLLGREPSYQGIIEPAAMAAAIAALEAAIATDEAARRESGVEEDDAKQGISLRRRMWPMVEMLRRCQAEAHPIVWGV